jgi:nitrite reductase/ring-hydroxylating ferredoxin subunit
MVPSGTLIEVGAAYGFFLLEAKAHYQVYGVEIAGEAAQFARARGLDVRTGSLTRQLLEEIGPIDVAVMLDVIEHLEHPKATLALCNEFLRPGGIIILTTPDFASALARVTGKGWRNMTPPQHLWYFTPDSITRVAAAAGLEVDQITHPWKRVPISLIVQLISRYIRVQLPRSVLSPLSKIGLPVNLFDAMRVVLRKPRSGRWTVTSDLTPGNTPAGFVKVGHVSELDGAGQFSRWVGNHDILVFRRNGVIRAFSNVCPHFGGPLGFHELTDGKFTCLWHNLQYDADTGQCLSVAKFKLREYELMINDGEIFANLVESGDSK